MRPNIRSNIHNVADDFTRLRALTWVKEFVIAGKEKLLPYSAQLLSGILPCLSHETQDILHLYCRYGFHNYLMVLIY